MSADTIRTSLAAVLSTVTGIGDVLAYPPDSIGALPAAYIADIRADVAMGSLEVWTYSVPLVVMTARKYSYRDERASLGAIRDAIMTAVRSNFTLSGTTYGIGVVGYEEGTITVGNDPYVAFTLTFSVKEKSGRTLTG